jgi:hypothetical protein
MIGPSWRCYGQDDAGELKRDIGNALPGTSPDWCPRRNHDYLARDNYTEPRDEPLFKCPFCGVEIENHPAGRCLDVWIWQDVYGCSAPVWDDQDLEPIYPETRSAVIPHYSTDGNASGDLMEKEHISLLCSEDGWYAVATEDIFHVPPRHGESYGSKEIHGKHQALADTRHLAVCRATLLKSRFALQDVDNAKGVCASS